MEGFQYTTTLESQLEDSAVLTRQLDKLKRLERGTEKRPSLKALEAELHEAQVQLKGLPTCKAQKALVEKLKAQVESRENAIEAAKTRLEALETAHKLNATQDFILSEKVTKTTKARERLTVCLKAEDKQRQKCAGFVKFKGSYAKKIGREFQGIILGSVVNAETGEPNLDANGKLVALTVAGQHIALPYGPEILK